MDAQKTAIAVAMGLSGSAAAQTTTMPSLNLSGLPLLFILGGLGVYFMTKYRDVGKVIAAIGVVSALGIIQLGGGGQALTLGGITGQTGMQQNMVDCGRASVLTHYAYDVEADSLTKAGPTWYTFDAATGNQLNAGTATNTTSTATCKTVNVYGDDSATYYVEPKLGIQVNTEADTLNIDAHSVVTASSMNFTCYDSDMNALTSDDNDINTADYTMSLGAGQEKNFYCKLDVNQANKAYRLNGIAVFTNNLNDIQVRSPGWHIVTLPKELRDATLYLNNDTDNNTATTWDALWIRDSPLLMKEFQTETIQFSVKAGTPNPVANNYSTFGMMVVDGGWSLGSDNKMYYDVYTHDSNEKVSDVGVAEAVTSPNGGDYSTVIEAS